MALRGKDGATNEVVSAWVVEGRTEQLPELEDVLFHIQVSLLARRVSAPSAR